MDAGFRPVPRVVSKRMTSAACGKLHAELRVRCVRLPPASCNEGCGVRFRNAPPQAAGFAPAVSGYTAWAAFGRSLALSSIRTTQVRAAIPAERGSRCRTSGLAPTSRRTRSLGRAGRRRIRNRLGGREKKTRPLRQPIADCIAGHRFRNVGSPAWSVVTDVRCARTKGPRVLDIRPPAALPEARCQGRVLAETVG